MSIITELKLKDAIKNQKVDNTYLLYGEEKYLIKVYTDMLKKSVLGDSYLDFNFQIFNGNIEIDTIYDAVISLPVMSSMKLIIVKDMDFSALNTVESDKLCDMLTQIPDTTVIIFSQLTSEVSLKRNAIAKKIFNIFSKNASVLECKKKNTSQVSQQLVRWAKKRGCELKYDNANKIVEYSSGEFMELTNEMEKLCAYCQNREITLKDIDNVMTKSITANVFELSKSICNKNYDRAYKQLDNLFYQREEPIMILAVLASAFIDMYRVKLVEQEKVNINILVSNFDYKNKQFRLNNAKRYASNMSLNQIGEIIENILDTDIKLKSIKCDKRVLLETLITKIITISAR